VFDPQMMGDPEEELRFLQDFFAAGGSGDL